MAAEGEVLEAKLRVRYIELGSKTIIGRATGGKMPFDWTINPYRGCEFGCKYCYARYTHEFMELREPEQFETMIFAKDFSAGQFRAELRRVPMRSTIAIGTATDPYQPAERRYGLTRRILGVLAGERGRSIALTTKSDLVARDVDLFSSIHARNDLTVLMTITTVDERLARVLEPYAPRPSLRLAALRKLADAGVRVTVLACPVMPLINDSVANLSAVARAAKDSGAIYMYGNVLFLKPCAQKTFFPMLERDFPHLVRRYRERYEKQFFVRGEYVETIRRRTEEIRTRYGLTRKPEKDEPAWAADDEPQLALFDELRSPAPASPTAPFDPGSCQ
jgi:DNA repair photolyase